MLKALVFGALLSLLLLHSSSASAQERNRRGGRATQGAVVGARGMIEPGGITGLGRRTATRTRTRGTRIGYGRGGYTEPGGFVGRTARDRAMDAERW